MNLIDRDIILFLNQLAQRSPAFDYFVSLISGNALLKTGVITALLSWAWFRSDEHSTDRRTTIVFGLFAACAAVLFARILSFVVPFRERPLRSPFIHFVLPGSTRASDIIGWSAFPSDNAVLYFALAACIFLVCRRAGILAFCHTSLVVAFSRVYLGYHYPTDILGGAILGVAAVSLIRIPSLKAAVTRAPMRWMQGQPQFFYPALFLLLFLIGTTFDPLYSLAHLGLVAGGNTMSHAAAFRGFLSQSVLWAVLAVAAGSAMLLLAHANRLESATDVGQRRISQKAQ